MLPFANTSNMFVIIFLDSCLTYELLKLQYMKGVHEYVESAISAYKKLNRKV